MNDETEYHAQKVTLDTDHMNPSVHLARSWRLAYNKELFCPLGIRALSRKYTDHALDFFPYNKSFIDILTKLARSRWLDIQPSLPHAWPINPYILRANVASVNSLSLKTWPFGMRLIRNLLGISS